MSDFPHPNIISHKFKTEVWVNICETAVANEGDVYHCFCSQTNLFMPIDLILSISYVFKECVITN